MYNEESLLGLLKSQKLDGHQLALMVEKGEITKQLRRKVSKKMAAFAAKSKDLSERQKLRQEIKEKKAQPKKTREDQINKYRVDPDREREEQKAKLATCLGCRKSGHILKNCPEAVKDVGICFNCGSRDHTLKDCAARRDPKGTLKFAKCFICNGVGHLARDCAENANGLYPKGGCCHICLQKTHLAKDCPERTDEERERHVRARQEAEDAELGPRIGLMATPETGGDALGESFEGFGDSDSDNNSESKPFSKKGDKKKKQKQKMSSDDHGGSSKKKRKLR